MSCVKVYGINKQPTNSKLKKDLVARFGSDKADILYNSVIWNDNMGDNSFLSYLNSKTDFLQDINGEPSIDEVLSWMEKMKTYNRINKKFTTNDFQTTTKEFVELSEGFTVLLLETLYEKKYTPNDLFQAKLLDMGTNEDNIMNVTLRKIIEKIQISDVEVKRKNQIIEALRDNKKEFYDSYNNYLEANLKFTIDTEAILSDNIENNEEKDTKDSAFNKSSFEFDSKDGAPKAIKILIAGLPEYEKDGTIVSNDLGLPKAVNYNNTFNFIQQTLVDIPGDITLMLEKLKSVEKVIPSLEIFTQRLNFGRANYIPTTDNKKQYAREQLVRTQFVNQFNKTKLEFTLHIKNEDGTVSLIDSNIDKVENVILKEWENNFKNNLLSNPNAFKEIEKHRAKGKKEFLEFLGILVEDESIVPTEILDDIYQYGIKTEEAFKNLYTPRKQEGVKSKLKKIASLVAVTSSETVDFQHFNAENKLVYGITLNTYLSSFAKELSYYAGSEELYSKFPELYENLYSNNSIWLDRILDGAKIKIGVFDGFKSDIVASNSKASKDLKARDLNMQRMIGILQEGKFPFLRSADRTTENYFYFENSKDLLVYSTNETKTYLFNHLKDELATMNEQLPIIHYDKNNLDFRVFYIIEDGKKVSLLNKFDSLENINSITNLEENPIISEFIDTMIEQIVEKERIQLGENGLLDKNTKSDEYIHIQGLVNSYTNVDNVISLFALNSYISSIEQTKTFIGDLALYKNPSDIFKRMSMLNSTKESARTDIEIDTYLSSLEYPFEITEGFERDNIDSKIPTVTIQDVVSKASEFDKSFEKMLKSIFGKDASRYMTEYNNMNEGDGFAYMTYDEYKRASIRFGEWLPQDELLYQKIAAGETEMAIEVMRRATVKKYQYTGKLLNFENTNVTAGRKFSIIPLIPGVIPEGSVLDKLNKDMLVNGVGMAFYESAAKFGHTIFENESGKVGSHIMYDNRGNMIIDVSTNHDILDYKYMGNQLKIHNDPKEKITASTQKRKLVKSNLYENGKVVSEEIDKLITKYDDIQSQIVKNAYKKTINNIEIPDGESIVDNKESLDNFADILIEQGLKQGYTTNELQSLSFLKELPLFDVLPNKQRIENLVMAKLKNNTVSNKRKGDALAQVPDIGFEINEETAKHAERHNLKFYRKSPDGKRMLPMEVMLALPQEFTKYVADIYGDGKLTDKALSDFNDDIAKDNEVFEKTGVKSELTKITTYIGFRIPNQAASSSDVAKIKKFLPPHMGSAIVVPKPIVAKTGSDFDIDKLFLYKPNISLVYENQLKIADDFLNDKDVSNNVLRGWLKKEYSNMTFESNVKKNFVELILLSPTENISHPVMQSVNMSFKKYLKEHKTKVTGIKYLTPKNDNFSEMTNSQLDNVLLETEIDITLNNANWKQLLAPLTATIIQDIVGEIRGLRGETGNQDHISDIFSNAKNIDKFIAFLSGKGGVGQVAVHITNHVLAQQSGLKMKPLHNYFGLESEIELGNIDNTAGQNISEVLSELLTAYVDIAKDPYILDLNAIQQTANTILMMLRWGIDPKTIFYFINQPIIVEFTKKQGLNESVISDKTTGKMNKNDLVQSVFDSFGISRAKSDKLNLISFTEQEIENGNSTIVRKDKIYEDFTDRALRKGIKDGKKADPDLQLQALDLFLEYQRQSKIFQKMIRSTSPDTQRFKNFTTLENQLLERAEVKESGMFTNYDKMFDSFIGEYYNVKEKYTDLIKDLFLTQNPKYKVEIDGLKELALSKTFGDDAKSKNITLIDNEFIRHILGVTGVITYEKGFNNLFKGDKSIPKIIKAIKAEFKEYDYTNTFIEEILPLIDDTGKGYDSMRLRTKKLSTSQKEIMTVDFKEFQEYDQWIEEEFGVKNFYKSLIAYQIIQSGINNSPFSFIDIIPSEDYIDLIKPGIFKAMNGNIPIEDYTGTTAELPGEFLMNNPQIWYKKHGLPFSVEYDVTSGKFLVILEGYTIEQLGGGIRYGMYNTYPNFKKISLRAREENSYIRDMIKPDNELNCTNNK